MKGITQRTQGIIDEIQEMIGREQRRKHILPLIMNKYGVKEAQTDKLIKKARQSLLIIHKENRPKTRSLSINSHLEHIREVRNINADLITSKDRHSLIHQIKKQVDLLEGNELPKEIKIEKHEVREIKVTFKRIQAPNTIIINK